MRGSLSCVFRRRAEQEIMLVGLGGGVWWRGSEAWSGSYGKAKRLALIEVVLRASGLSSRIRHASSTLQWLRWVVNELSLALLHTDRK